MAGYDLKAGARIWHLNNGGEVPVPTPLFANGLINLTNGHGRSPTFAIQPTATSTVLFSALRRSVRAGQVVTTTVQNDKRHFSRGMTPILRQAVQELGHDAVFLR